MMMMMVGLSRCLSFSFEGMGPKGSVQGLEWGVGFRVQGLGVGFRLGGWGLGVGGWGLGVGGWGGVARMRGRVCEDRVLDGLQGWELARLYSVYGRKRVG